MTIDEKKDQINKLSINISRICNEYIHNNGLIEKWAITDPAKVDEYHKLLDLLDHHMKLYMDDVIPWNNEIHEEVEVIQPTPESTPISVKVKRYNFAPTVMQTARDIMIFAVLP